MIAAEQMGKIKKYAIHMDWEVAFHGRAKGNQHLSRVASIAKGLAKQEEAREDICEAGAWLHDIGLAKDFKNRNYKGLDLAEPFLKGLGLSEEDISAVLECVLCHDGFFKATRLEAKIVHDADTLDKTGPLGIIRETWKRSQAGWNSEKIARHLKTHLRKRQGNLYTQTAKRLAAEWNAHLESFFRQLEEQLDKGSAEQKLVKRPKKWKR